MGPAVQRVIEDDPYISERALGEQSDKLLLRPLKNVDLNQAAAMLIVIDALDECESEEYKDDIKVILQLLLQVQTSKCVRLRFFLASRPELPIRLSIEKIQGELQNLDLHDVPTSDITQDISIVLRYAFSQIQQDHKLSTDWPGDEVIEVLVERTVPLFISAVTLHRFINDVDLNMASDLDTPVRLLHLSFRDFLLDTRTKDAERSGKFWIDEKAAHQILTNWCLEVMRHNLRKNICNLPDDSTQRSILVFILLTIICHQKYDTPVVIGHNIWYKVSTQSLC
jgi:hypothetical protein